jgi:hypothetical protein
MSKAQKQRLVSQKKFNCGVRKQVDSKAVRPKTSKKIKAVNGRVLSGQSQKFT